MSEIILRNLANLLPRFAYRFADEAELHKGISKVLNDAGIEFQHELIAGPNDRFDFLCEPGIVIEAKIKGSFSQAMLQIDRYAGRDDVLGIILVATRFWADTPALRKEAAVRGKPLRLVRLRGQSF